MRLLGDETPRRVPRPRRQHPPGAAAGVPGRARAAAGVRRRRQASPAAPSTSSTRGVDTGPIIAQAAVPVHEDDDDEALRARILAEEHRLLPAVVTRHRRTARGHRRPQGPHPRRRAVWRCHSQPVAAVDTNFYDVVVCGGETSGLVAGALLARRGFRVLLLGHEPAMATFDAAGETCRARRRVAGDGAGRRRADRARGQGAGLRRLDQAPHPHARHRRSASCCRDRSSTSRRTATRSTREVETAFGAASRRRSARCSRG